MCIAGTSKGGLKQKVASTLGTLTVLQKKGPRGVNAAKRELGSRDSVRLGRTFQQPAKAQGHAALFFLSLERGEHFERLAICGDGYAKIVKSKGPFRRSAPFDLQVGSMALSATEDDPVMSGAFWQESLPAYTNLAIR